jgi:Protein of unknown function (DUF3467)
MAGMDGAADLTPQAEPELRVITPPEVFPGHWANAASVARTPHEFTIDFFRVGPGGEQAMMVSRINCSPLLLGELLQTLQEQWDAYKESKPE